MSLVHNMDLIISPNWELVWNLLFLAWCNDYLCKIKFLIILKKFICKQLIRIMFFLLKFSYFGHNENKIKPKSQGKKSLRIYAINTLKKSVH